MVVTQRVQGRSLCWRLSARLTASLALKEAGAGPAAAWAERGSFLGHSSSLGLQTKLGSTWALGQPLRREKIVASPSPRGTQPSGRCSGAGPGWGQPLDGCGELRLGVNCI